MNKEAFKIELTYDHNHPELDVTLNALWNFLNSKAGIRVQVIKKDLTRVSQELGGDHTAEQQKQNNK